MLLEYKPDWFLGYYGYSEEDEFYESVFDRDGQRRTRNVHSETGFNIYHGKIVRFNKYL